MNSRLLVIPVFLLGILFVGQVPDSLGHGLGSETMPPVMIDGMEATLEVNSSTIYTDVDGKEKGIRQISINFFESFTNIDSNEVKPINNVTFQVELIKSGSVLINETFQRDDGVLIMNLTPSENEQVRVMERATVASFLGLASEQYNFEGEIFENGGLYEFKISVITINSYDNVLSDPIDYELGISIEETTRYEINDENYGKQKLGIVTFFDQITDFDYNTDTKEITFSFPFEWDQRTIDQTTVIHEEILVPKTYGDLLVTKYVVTLNELDLPESMINIDDFSSDDRLVHIVVSQKELQEIFSNNQFNDDTITVKVKPESDLPLSGVTENGQFKINLWWNEELKSGQNSTLYFDILDTFLKDRPIAVSYNLGIFHDGKEIAKTNGISSDLKTQSNSFEFFIPSDVSGIINVKFQKLDYSKVANLEIPLIVDRKNVSTSDYKIPEWVKNNAGWWADGQIPDSAFVQGIQFLIKEGVIIIEQEQSEKGPQEIVKPLNLTISSPSEFEKYFEKYVDVFGVPIYATTNTSDDKVLHAANVLAQYLDNDADGTPDNPLVVEKIKANNGGIPLFSEPDVDDDILYTASDEYTEYCWVALYEDETNPRNQFDASLEEILHMITQCGYAEAYPEIFGEHEDSLIAEYMDNARGGFFDQVPSSYPAGAWYSYDDYTCEYECMITEYFYWTMTSILGAQEDRLDEIGHEWKLNTKEKVMETDPDIYNLLTDLQYKLPTIIPDGNYQG